jgi:type IV pilus assembly protein PilN
MIKVNLLAASPAVAESRSEWLPREQRSALIGIAMLAVTAIGTGGWWWYLSYTKSSIDTRIAAAEVELVRLREAARLLEQATARRTLLAERLSLIDQLRASKRAPVSLLETVSRSVPEGLWLLEIKQTGTSIQVDGRALSITSVTDFAQRMQNSGLFERPVEILTALNEDVNSLTVVRFAIKAETAQPLPAAGVPSAMSATSTAGTPAGRPGV